MITIRKMRYKERIDIMNKEKEMIDVHKIYKQRDFASKDFSEKEKGM